jgi:hypothetical protein
MAMFVKKDEENKISYSHLFSYIHTTGVQSTNTCRLQVRHDRQSVSEGGPQQYVFEIYYLNFYIFITLL